jgi:serine protease Do
MVPKRILPVRYATALTTALLIGGTAVTMAVQSPINAQTAVNEPGAIQAPSPRPGAPLSFADMVAKLQPAVVNISTKQKVQVQQGGNPFAGTPFGDLFGGGNNNAQPVTRESTSLGSGFIISDDGYIVTNNHVIANPQNGSTPVGSITVTLMDRKEYPATLVGRDASSDLAVLKIDAKGLPFVKFGDSTRTRVGDWVIAIGQPYGLGGTVTAGIVSALHRNIGQGGAYDRYIQTDASINQGNSGGPMFDLNGNVIGINNAIFSPNGGSVGIGFAIPAEQAAPVVQSLKSGIRPKRGYLGIQLNPMSEDIYESLGLPKNQGELVARVELGQAAARAGIQAGDVIVKVNNRAVTPDETLSFIVSNLPVGSRVPIELIRGGKRLSVTASLGERPTDEQLIAQAGNDNGGGLAPENDQSTAQATKESLGLSVQPLTAEIARQVGVSASTRGLVIAQVDPSSDAGAKGLQRGDIILSANQTPVTTAAGLSAAVASAKAAGRSSVLLQIQRGTNPVRFIGVRFSSK